MPNELVKILDQFTLGTAISFLIMIGGCAVTVLAIVKREIKKIKDIGSQEVLNKMEDDQEHEKLILYGKEIEKMKDEVVRIKEEITEDANNTERIYNDMKEKLTKIDALENEIAGIRKEIMTLLTSTLSINRSLILQVYNRCVVNEKSIDLISLQNVEGLYRDYLAEVKDGGDEFIAKIMREIRDLPPRSE